jgi:mannose-6-phosphate isomerase-like protein (cupin superfamily)
MTLSGGLRAAMVAGMVLATGCLVASAAEPAGARLWTGADLESLDKALIEKMGDARTAYTQVIDGRTYGALVMHREVTADPELHVRRNDFFVILGGEGQIRVGGTVTGERTLRPDEKLAQRLEGGKLYPVRQGDVLFVPANVWHQVIVAKGKVLSAILIKAQ